MSIERATSSKRRRSEAKADQHVEAEELRSKAERRSKKSKSSRFNIPSDALNWKPVKTAPMGGFDDGGGMMMFEELDGVDVKWEEGANGQKTAKFVPKVSEEEDTNVAEGKKQKKDKGKKKAVVPKVVEQSEDEDEDVSASSEEEEFPEFNGFDQEELDEEDDEVEAEVESEPEFDDSELSEWKEIKLHNALKKALVALEFNKPTDIQTRSLPFALDGRDIVGVAETGSGKTLAYSLPILSHILRSPPPTAGHKRPLSALILCPTRELAIQVVDHLNKVVAQAVEPTKSPPRISIGSVVGGLSSQKQKRIVERGCDILVATPGRLWDLMKSDEELSASVRAMRFLCIDEADRMIENGHFAELENIVRLTERQPQATGPDEDDPVFANAANVLSDTEAREDMQTFVFSATLSKDLQNNLKRKQRVSKKGSKKATALEDLVERLDFRDKAPEVIDLSPEGGVVKMLKESMIDCVMSDKDLYLYYFLLRYPGRSLVFVGSIDGIRRLMPLFEVLQMPVFPLHSQLQQRQRLKNLDRFKSSKNGVLIATDVAARGLDIPLVEHVVHFNLPRTADAYIHRSGRTARAQKPGFALLLCSAEEKGTQRALMKSLGRTLDMPELPIESGFLPKLKERLALAKEIEKAQHVVKKENHDKNWLKEAAEAMDVDIDPSLLSDPEDTDLPFHTKGRPSSRRTVKAEGLKAELKALLKEPLVARGVSAKYPTSGSKVIIDDLLASAGHGTLLGAPTLKAHEEVQKPKKKLFKKKPVKPKSTTS